MKMSYAIASLGEVRLRKGAVEKTRGMAVIIRRGVFPIQKTPWFDAKGGLREAGYMIGKVVKLHAKV